MGLGRGTERGVYPSHRGVNGASGEISPPDWSSLLFRMLLRDGSMSTEVKRMMAPPHVLLCAVQT